MGGKKMGGKRWSRAQPVPIFYPASFCQRWWLRHSGQAVESIDPRNPWKKLGGHFHAEARRRGGVSGVLRVSAPPRERVSRVLRPGSSGDLEFTEGCRFVGTALGQSQSGGKKMGGKRWSRAQPVFIFYPTSFCQRWRCCPTGQRRPDTKLEAHSIAALACVRDLGNR